MTPAPLPLTGVLPLGRPTFDVPYAQARLAAMLDALRGAGASLTGPNDLLMTPEATRTALDALRKQGAQHVMILQVTFTDAAMTAEIAATLADVPLSIWAIPEPRAGGRLRLNSFCGLNLASHALGLRGRAFSAIYAAPEDAGIAETLQGTLQGKRLVQPMPLPAPKNPSSASGPGAVAAAGLAGRRIGRIGAHPDGFDTCAYDPEALRELTGAEVQVLALDDLFARARALPGGATAASRAQAANVLAGLDDLDQDQLEKSLRLRVALDDIRAEQRLDAMAIRCWPETFTEYGGAVCGPVSMLAEGRAPCACEADVYGALTQILLQDIADAPVFLVDLVDLDPTDDTGVVWHCGQAPVSMRDAQGPAQATIHTNRKMPLLFEFTLRPGRVTFARISRAQGQPRLVIASGEMLRRPMAYTGTSGVLRFDIPAAAMLVGVLNSGLEHHMALAYGDHRAALAQAAARLGLPLQDLTAERGAA